MYSIGMYKELEYSYPNFLDNRLSHWFWKKFCCKHGWHLFDEYSFLNDNKEWENRLSCDACGESIKISDKYVENP